MAAIGASFAAEPTDAHAGTDVDQKVVELVQERLAAISGRSVECQEQTFTRGGA